ncbi:hypothetical protein Droror1_Dr00027434 [Drosera rotundifolia]
MFKVCPGSWNQSFTAKGILNLTTLSNAEIISLLQYHALNNYSTNRTLKTTKDLGCCELILGSVFGRRVSQRSIATATMGKGNVGTTRSG